MTPLPNKTLLSHSILQTDSINNKMQEQKNWRRFGLFLLIYFLVWSIAPAFLASSVPLDVGEGINWGSEWQWGYYKHPPFSSWVLYSFYRLFGHIGPYLLSQLYVLLTLFLVYQLGKKVWNQQTALLGGALTLAVIYYTYPSLEFNHNVAQFPIWAGLYLFFYQAVTRNKVTDWLIFGIIGGLGMLTKYTVIFLLIPMALFLLLPKQWVLLKTSKPWMAAAVMLAVFAPHLYWLIQHDWLPFEYASGRSDEALASTSRIQQHFTWVSFLIAQLVAHIPLLFILAFNRKRLTRVSEYKQNLPAGTALLWYLWAAPIGVLVILSLGFGIGLRDMWGMPMWALSGLLAASFVIPAMRSISALKLRKFIMIWLVFVTIIMMVYVGFGDKMRHKPSRMQWPEQALATQAQKTWQSVSHCDLDSVSGDRWLGALVAMNSHFPSQMISGPASHSPWMTTERLQNNGTLVMWQADSTIELPLLDNLMTVALNSADNRGLVQQQGQWQINWRDPKVEKPLLVNWIAYVPSHCTVMP